MNFLFAIIIGLIQGITEFFPISSSAHLKLFSYFFPNSLSSNIMFELICNLGSMLAAIIFLRKHLLSIFLKNRIYLLYIFLAILPLVPIYLLYGNLKKYLDSFSLLGIFFLLSALIIFLASKIDFSKKKQAKKSDYVFIGMMQCFALIPGISRSGATISGALFRGWNIKEAISFSFTLAIFTVTGGNFLEALKLYKSSISYNIPAFYYSLGFITSFLMGLLTIRFIFAITSKNKLLPFVWYLSILGTISIIYFNFF